MHERERRTELRHRLPVRQVAVHDTRQHGDDTRDGRTHRGALQHRKDSTAGQNRGAAPRRAAPRPRRARAAPRRARAAPRRTAAAPHAPHVTLIVRVRPSPWCATSAPQAAWLRTPSHRGRFLRSKVRSQETHQRLHFLPQDPPCSRQYAFYSRPQAAGCLVGCSADVENIGSWRRAANANKASKFFSVRKSSGEMRKSA